MIFSLVALAIALCFSLDFVAAEAKQPSKSVKEACAQEKPVIWNNGLRYVDRKYVCTLSDDY